MSICTLIRFTAFDKLFSAFLKEKLSLSPDPFIANQSKEKNSFDAIYNIKKIETANQTLDYTQDKTGLITKKNNTDYTYDKIGRLTKAGAESFSYDKAGNNQNNSAVYNILNNQMSENALYRITYDAMGNIASKYNKLDKTTSKYTFNARNQLISYSKQDENNNSTKTLSYTYDAFNRRVSKTEDNNVTHKYLYDGDDIVAILDNNKQVIATITHDESIDTPLSISNVNGTFYYHRDHQGSIIALTDSSGAVVESFTYDNHYGTITKHTKTTETNNPYGYTGRELDTEELYYYRARYYDPMLQRFLGEDPIGFLSRDFNFYRYTWNSPAEYTDAMGLTAYNCKVPLHSLPWLRGIPPFYHQYTCVKINGGVVCDGMDRTGSPLWSPGTRTYPNDKYIPSKCKKRRSNLCFEYCLIDEWEKTRPQYGIGPQSDPGDCQEYDDYVNDKCFKKCLGKDKWTK